MCRYAFSIQTRPVIDHPSMPASDTSARRSFKTASGRDRLRQTKIPVFTKPPFPATASSRLPRPFTEWHRPQSSLSQKSASPRVLSPGTGAPSRRVERRNETTRQISSVDRRLLHEGISVPGNPSEIVLKRLASCIPAGKAPLSRSGAGPACPSDPWQDPQFRRKSLPPASAALTSPEKGFEVWAEAAALNAHRKARTRTARGVCIGSIVYHSALTNKTQLRRGHLKRVSVPWAANALSPDQRET